MKIRDVQIGKIKSPLKRPFKTALRTAYFIEDLVIKIITENGLIGYGSCVPTPTITGETEGSLLAALHILKEKLLKTEFQSLEKILNLLRTCFVKNNSALACFDMALHDVYSQSLNLPLYQYLGGDKNILFTSLTISANDINTMIQDSLDAVKNGFYELKIKVGLDAEHDFHRILEIAKAVGPKIKLRIDANQGWDVKQSLQIIHKLDHQELNIEFIEQPIQAHNVEGLAFLRRRVNLPILADESVFSLQEAYAVLKQNAADMINIKLAKCGGIYPATKIIHLAESAGVECMLGCMLESHISITAAVHFAASKKNISRCDLDPPFLMLENPVESSVSFDGNALTINENVCGLGIKTIHGFELLK